MFDQQCLIVRPGSYAVLPRISTSFGLSCPSGSFPDIPLILYVQAPDRRNQETAFTNCCKLSFRQNVNLLISLQIITHLWDGFLNKHPERFIEEIR